MFIIKTNIVGSIISHIHSLQLGGPVSSSPMTLGPILKKRLTVRGSTLRSRSLDYKGKIIAEVHENNALKICDYQIVHVCITDIMGSKFFSLDYRQIVAFLYNW